MPAKSAVTFICSDCDSVFPKWQGQCSACGAWNTLEAAIPDSPAKVSPRLEALPLSYISTVSEEYVQSGIAECDHVLGQGFVKGSVTLLGGEPGVGKSTMSLQVAMGFAQQGKKVLYVTGEESLRQIQIRAKRLGVLTENLLVLAALDMAQILACIRDSDVDAVILDSIQVVFHKDLPSVSGTVNQVRHCANQFIQLVKEKQLIGIMIGHITKDGFLAGPKVLEHMVDVILYFEGERSQQFRVLRCFKNRYANTQEIGLFEMKTEGLIPIPNPSALFIDQSTLAHAGSVVSAVAEGSRILLVEIQALVVDSGYGMARRTILGMDANRANLMIATIEKLLGLRLSQKDIVLNVIGGLKVKEPALDLGILLAILSSLKNRPLPEKTGVFAEVGLTGELRAVPHYERRLLEIERMGFSRCLVPEKNAEALSAETGLQLVSCQHIQEAAACLMPN